jgi:hypothetical protein
MENEWQDYILTSQLSFELMPKAFVQRKIEVTRPEWDYKPIPYSSLHPMQNAIGLLWREINA